MNYLVEDIARFSLFVPVIFYFFAKSKDRSLQVLFYFLLFIFIHQIVFNSLVIRESKYTIPFNAFYTPIELLFTALYIRPHLKSTTYKSFVFLSLAIFFICWTPFLIFEKTEDYLSYIRAVTYSLILMYCLLYFYEQMRYPQTLFIYSQRQFWGIAGFLLFAAGTFFIFLFDQFSITVDGFLEQYVYIHAILFIIRNLFFAISFIIRPEKIPFAEISPLLT